MPLHLIRQDITKIEADAIVNAANETLLGGCGVDGAIHKAAGEGLLKECAALGGCKTGEAKITKGYKLPCRHVIHTVGPVWKGGACNEEQLLISCYRNCLRLAKENGCETVAFPLISSGSYGYPKTEALNIAVSTITEFLEDNEMTVYITIFDRAAFDIGQKLYSDIQQFIDDAYVGSHEMRYSRQMRGVGNYPMAAKACVADESDDLCELCSYAASSFDDELEKRIKELDESFTQMLLRKIDERGMTDVECYKKANVDRKLFSKIRSDVNYKPSKSTAIAFAISLKLSLSETSELLKKAGYALSRSNKFDVIIEFFISKGKYDIYEINEALFAFDQSLLGA